MSPIKNDKTLNLPVHYQTITISKSLGTLGEQKCGVYLGKIK